MAAEQRKLLEQLMGPAHTNPMARGPQLALTDPKVCRSYIVGTCPRELFTNTKQDAGPCPKVHAEALKAEWDELPESQKQRLGFEYDYLRDLHKYIEQCNQRIQSAQLRLEKTPDEIRQTNVLLQTITDLTASISDGLLEAEILGELGEVHRAADELFRIRQAQQSKAERERELKSLSETQGPSGHQKLQVCDVCGAYLSRLDNDRRLADHFYGKMHLGYAQMRKAWDSFPKEKRARIGGRGDKGGPAAAAGGGGGGSIGGGGGGGFDDDFDRENRDRDRDRAGRERSDRGPGGPRGGKSGGAYRGRGRGFRGGW